jgi:hypothetical protein
MLLNGPVVDRPDAPTLASPLCTPAELPQSPTAGNELTLFRPQEKRQLKRPILLVIEMTADTRGEDQRLDEAH